MQPAAVVFLHFIAIATGSILDHELITEVTGSLGKWDPRFSAKTSCPLHNPQEGSPLRFVDPDPMPVLTVVFQRYIAINCSAVNFCNVTWSWQTAGPFQLGYHAELTHDDQVLEIQQAFYSRHGNYTCSVTDGGRTVNRTVELFVTDTPWEKPPLPLSGDACINQTASDGGTAEFFCFFFAGETVQDVELAWHRRNAQSDWVPISELSSEKILYQESLDYSVHRSYSGSKLQPTAGMHLTIKDVTLEAYVDYRLQAASEYGSGHTQPLSLSAPPDPPKPDLTPIIATSVVGFCLLILIISLAVTWHFVKLDVKIWRKNRFGAVEDDDGKTYDAFITYADKDRAFALTIRDQLMEAGYSVCFPDIDFLPPASFVEEIVLALNTSRRYLLVITPEFISAQHSGMQVDLATDQLLKNQLKIVPILYRAVPKAMQEEIPSLRRLLSNVRTVAWSEKHPERFAKQLLVHMPPRRQSPPDANGLTAPRRRVVEERNLLDESLISNELPFGIAAAADNGRPPSNLEMDRFLNDVAVAEAERKNTVKVEVHHPMPS